MQRELTCSALHTLNSYAFPVSSQQGSATHVDLLVPLLHMAVWMQVLFVNWNFTCGLCPCWSATILCASFLLVLLR